MKLKIDERDTETQHPNVPKGYRVIEDYELLKELRTNKELKEIAIEGWITVNTVKGLRTAGLCVGDDFLVLGDYDLSYGGRSRGVFVKK